MSTEQLPGWLSSPKALKPIHTSNAKATEQPVFIYLHMCNNSNYRKTSRFQEGARVRSEKEEKKGENYVIMFYFF